jgi:hypothetical protein
LAPQSFDRSTQLDPIGLAGGLNLYGFAGGDPVNFGDPFGLAAEGGGDPKDRAIVVATLAEQTGMTAAAVDSALASRNGLRIANGRKLTIAGAEFTAGGSNSITLDGNELVASGYSTVADGETYQVKLTVDFTKVGSPSTVDVSIGGGLFNRQYEFGAGMANPATSCTQRKGISRRVQCPP